MNVPALIAELAGTERDASEDEIRRIREYVAERGFDPDALERVRGRGAGIVWRGRTLRGRDQLPPAEAHYVRHVLARPEWPTGTTLFEFLHIIEQVVRDESGAVLLSKYAGRLQIGFLTRTGYWKGPEGEDWTLVDFRHETDHIATAYQVTSPERVAHQSQRSDVQWLKHPSA